MASARPLFPTYIELKDFVAEDYPSLTRYLEQGVSWKKQHWQWACDFLIYIGRNKSEHTYVRFRNDTERFMLWLFEIHKKPIDDLRKADILSFIDFCVSPPVNWISTINCERFQLSNGVFNFNPEWKPFRLAKAKSAPNQKLDKKKYRPSQQTIISTFVALSSLYRHLMDEEMCYANPVPVAKKDCRHLIKNSQVKSINRLTAEQWSFVLKSAEKMAQTDSIHERSLFVIVVMKTLFLRVSELSTRRDWVPIMGHFWQDDTENWWFKAYGKGKKIRDVTVPSDFISYLKRYREYRGLLPLPTAGEQQVLVEKIRGVGGLTTRQITRIVQEVFDQAYKRMSEIKGPDSAQKLKEATTHYLRHTGASMEIEDNRPLKDLSEDLGHASSATTDTVYVQVERRKRAQSGKKRRVLPRLVK